MVRGTRANVRALMRDGQNILVFPGGADEVFKARGQEYRLMWKERLGFARLAIEFGYPIVPFAAVGAEEMLHVLADQPDADRGAGLGADAASGGASAAAPRRAASVRRCCRGPNACTSGSASRSTPADTVARATTTRLRGRCATRSRRR